MVMIDDIYFRIDRSIVAQRFWNISIEEQKKLIDSELKKYIISKIQELGCKKELTSERVANYNVFELLNILAKNIPQEKHFNTLSHFTHYILQVAGSLQGYSVTWWEENEEELIQSPFIKFNEKGLWSDLKTHKNTDYVQTFCFAYDVFNNKFMVENSPKKLVMRLPKNKR